MPMSFSRLFLPLLFAFVLLFAQQGGITHALNHTLAGQNQPENNQPENNQKDKQAPHSPACDQCASYAQLGGALNSTYHSFAVITTPATSVQQHTVSFNSIPVLAASARGPPALQRIA